MVDFHSHLLPAMDDGADNAEVSLRMLRLSARQGVDVMFATPHFYAEETDPQTFLQERERSYRMLLRTVERSGEQLPQIRLGAEVHYYPGMSVSDELRYLTMEGTPCLLVEPPMRPVSESVLDEIALTGENLRVIPVIAHADRYMRLTGDFSLTERLRERRMFVQVNASYFLREETVEYAVADLVAERIQFLGSDAHNLDERAPNLGLLPGVVRRYRAERAFELLNRRVERLLSLTDLSN